MRAPTAPWCRAPSPTVHGARRRVARAAIALLVLGCLGALPAELSTPGTPGTELVLDPPVLRPVDGRATVALVLGADAGDDVVATLLVRPATTDGTGAVTAGEGEVAGVALDTTTVRLRPGERADVGLDVAAEAAPAVVEVSATAASAAPEVARPPAATGDPAVLRTLVLPGAPPSVAPTLELGDATPEGTPVTVSAPAPVLVSVRLTGGGDQVTATDRLVLPDAPLELTTPPARWPRTPTAAVTDELGRTTTVRADRALPLLVAGSLLAVALLALGVAVRPRRPVPAA